jgi:hypothetical protein
MRQWVSALAVGAMLLPRPADAQGLTGAQGSGSRIEARGSGFETRFGPEYLKHIPTRRFGIFDLIRAAPGVSPKISVVL